jgi:periplasmic divalent cation tolerance protein
MAFQRPPGLDQGARSLALLGALDQIAIDQAPEREHHGRGSTRLLPLRARVATVAGVEERLAAGANVLDGVASIYWWAGAIEQASEAVLIVKTRADLVERLSARIKALHSYDCPCVVALPIAGGNPDYLEWIRAETA